jgi:hypothetical protein
MLGENAYRLAVEKFALKVCTWTQSKSIDL